MFASYGENSGFSPASGEELTTVNGGLRLSPLPPPLPPGYLLNLLFPQGRK
jgi:hypothetical protein